MKVIGVAIGLVLLLVIGVFVYVAYNTNSIVKNAIETIGPQYLGAPVRVKDVDISLQDGRGTLTNLEVGNPPGYEGPYAVRVGTVSVTLDVAHSTSGLVVLKRVTIDGARVAAVAKSAKETNLRTLVVERAVVEELIADQTDHRRTRCDEHAGRGVVAVAVESARGQCARTCTRRTSVVRPAAPTSGP